MFYYVLDNNWHHKITKAHKTIYAGIATLICSTHNMLIIYTVLVLTSPIKQVKSSRILDFSSRVVFYISKVTFYPKEF